MTYEFSLPWPPSVNRYWRNVLGRMVISREGRAYKKAVADAFTLAYPRHTPLSCPVAVRLELLPPDRRRRDMDNTFKALFDALTGAGAWEDDAQVRQLCAVMRESTIPGGLVRVKFGAAGGYVPAP